MFHSIKQHGDQVTLVLSGQFTSRDRGEFIKLIPSFFISNSKSIVIDMAELSYMDSVGLGMLVSLRDEAGKKGIRASITNPAGEVKELLELACFDRLFAIS